MPPDEPKTVTRHESFGVLRSDWKLIARIEEGLCKALRRRGANDVATPSSAMSTSALIRLHAAEHADMVVLLRRLKADALARIHRSAGSGWLKGLIWPVACGRGGDRGVIGEPRWCRDSAEAFRWCSRAAVIALARADGVWLVFGVSDGGQVAGSSRIRASAVM